MFLKHCLIYLGARGIPAIINLFSLTIFTHLLSPDSYGKYAIIIASTSLINSAIFQWLRFGLLRFLPLYENKKEVFISTIFYVYLLLVFSTGVIGGIVFTILRDPIDQKLLFFALVLLWSQAWYALNLDLVRIQLTPKKYGIIEFSRATITLLIGGSLAYIGWGVYGLLIGTLAALLLSVLHQFFKEWRVCRINLVDKELIKKIFVYGFPLTITVTLNFVINSSDRLFLGWYFGADAAGSYAVGYDLAQRTLGVLMFTVNLAGYPLVTHALKENLDAAQSQLKQNFLLLLGISLPATAGIALLAPGISEIFLGDAFKATAIAVMPWVVLAILISGIKSYYFDLSFQLGTKTGKQVWIVFVSASVNILLNLWLIPALGFMGAAYSTVAAYFVGMVLSVYFGREVFPLPKISPGSFKIVISTACMAVMLWALRDVQGGALWLSTKVALGMVVYFAFLFIFNVGGCRKYFFESIDYIFKRVKKAEEI